MDVNYKNLYFMLFNGITDIVNSDTMTLQLVEKKLRELQADAEDAYIDHPYILPKAIGFDDYRENL